MAMIHTPEREEGEDPVMATINTTPLVDVMLVLLIIFLITIPVVIHTVPVHLPRENSQPEAVRPHTLHLTVDESGHLYLEQQALPVEQIKPQLKGLMQNNPHPIVQIRGDYRAHFRPFAQILQACKELGLSQVSFVTEPTPAP